jgi:transposase-like protein
MIKLPKLKGYQTKALAREIGVALSTLYKWRVCIPEKKRPMVAEAMEKLGLEPINQDGPELSNRWLKPSWMK